MEKEKIVNWIENGYSIRKISKESGLSYSTIRYWMKKYDISTVLKSSFTNIDKTERLCFKCNEAKNINLFYPNSDKYGNIKYGYCKKCSNEYSTLRAQRVKLDMILYKGGCCDRCKLKIDETHSSVFDFHHTNPLNKDPNFNRIKLKNWNKIKSELDKCILLCSNCHRIIHSE